YLPHIPHPLPPSTLFPYTTLFRSAGINIAQRVIDCGDAGHILISKHLAEDVEQYGDWKRHLHDLGQCEVKHGVRVSVVNLYTEEDRKSTRLNSSHRTISYAVFCLK